MRMPRPSSSHLSHNVLPIDKCLEATHGCLVIQWEDIFCLNRYVALICVCLKNNDLKEEGKKSHIIDKMTWDIYKNNWWKELYILQNPNVCSVLFCFFEVATWTCMEADLELWILLPSFTSHMLGLHVWTADDSLNPLHFQHVQHNHKPGFWGPCFLWIQRTIPVTGPSAPAAGLGSCMCLTRVGDKKPCGWELLEYRHSWPYDGAMSQ